MPLFTPSLFSLLHPPPTPLPLLLPPPPPTHTCVLTIFHEGVPRSYPKTTIGSDGHPDPVGVEKETPAKFVAQSLSPAANLKAVPHSQVSKPKLLPSQVASPLSDEPSPHVVKVTEMSTIEVALILEDGICSVRFDMYINLQTHDLFAQNFALALWE